MCEYNQDTTIGSTAAMRNKEQKTKKQNHGGNVCVFNCGGGGLSNGVALSPCMGTKNVTIT